MRASRLVVVLALLASASGCRLFAKKAQADAGATDTTSAALSADTGSSAHAKGGKHKPPSRASAAAGDKGPPSAVFSCLDDASEPTECTEFRDLPASMARIVRKECKSDENVLREGPCPRKGVIGVCKIPVDMDDRVFAYEAIYEGETAAEIAKRCKDSEGGTFSATFP